MENFETFEPLEKELSKSETKINNYSSKMILAIILGIIIGLVSTCAFFYYNPEYVTTDELINQTELAYLYGINYGMEYTVATITNQSIQCNQIPMNYSGYVYTLYPLECLNLNNEGGKK